MNPPDKGEADTCDYCGEECEVGKCGDCGHDYCDACFARHDCDESLVREVEDAV